MGRVKDSVSSYIRYRFSVQSKFSLHSPFIYKFWADVLKDDTRYPAYSTVKQLRKELLRDDRIIHQVDFGAGQTGRPQDGKTVKVKGIARNSAVSAAKGRFLYKLVKFNQPSGILELGTSLGISALYMSEAAPRANIQTIEGCPETAAIARSNFEKAGKQNISVITGSFDEKLQDVLRLMPKPDLVFIDGNHRKEPTVKYFEECLPHLHAGTIVAMDDIHWSKEMEEAWKTIIAHPKVKVSVDLFYLGVIFFREELSKEDFVLRF
ncbi:MAG: class I SAM-dependent methyltransferase [Bacteroidetes bacterium]|nr:class I SAM-dependent methyltransferase [Bacteroidota bacterium]